MNSSTLDIIQKEAQDCAANKRLSFYEDLAPELSYSRQIFFDHPLILRCCEDVLPFLNDEPRHGIKHAKNVAIESGAIVLAESFYQDQEWSRHFVLLAQIAGLLHDICRSEEDHATEGAKVSQHILEDYPLTDRDKAMVASAIDLHEAFQPYTPPEDPEEFFLSGALYDADKFRWGPDNFITTLWEICDYEEWSLNDIKDKFPEGLRIIESIQDTFRTQTGQVYGPEFIEAGLEIGDFVYRRLRQETQANS